MEHANPGLRPGLSLAVPAGLDFVMVGSHTQTLQPALNDSLVGDESGTEIQNLCFPCLVEQPEQAPFLCQ
jgi:hypothetical protein